MKRTLLTSVFLIPLLFTYAYPSETVRYLLAVGANNGGGNRETLKYAVSDAQSFTKIMNQLGGIPAERMTVLVDPRPDQFIAELERLEKQIRDELKGIKRTEVIFYYSGHSDEEGLLLGSKTMPYTDLHDRIKALPADVKIAILDSCSSGAFTRVKGGKMITPFMSDSSQDMRGFAFMTSSSADEVSQESDRIGGSFFTHYLISGLRGAADGKRDGQVTLNEAYQYAYRETLTRTARTIGGAQHPNYNIQMTGTGDVILTDIRSGGALLTLADSLDGRFFISSGTSLVAEFTKEKGGALSFSIPDGKYSIVRDSDGNLSETKIAVRKNDPFTVREQSFTPIAKEDSVQRGNKPPVYALNPFTAYLIPLSGEEKSVEHVQLYLIGSRCAKLDGLSLGIGVGAVSEELHGVALSAIGSVCGGTSSFLQAAGVFTYTGKDFTGVQASAVCNYTGNDFSGFQASGAVNFISGNFSGMQTSSAFNMTNGDFTGLQTTGGVNIAGGNFAGMQAGVVNYSGTDFTGFQAGVVNVANGFSGFQAGILNLTKRFDSGFQLGVVNYAGRFDGGLQLGVFNWCGECEDGYPIGLITIVRNGETHGNIVMEENGFLCSTLTHGTKKFYNIYSVGTRTGGKQSSQGLGFGRKFESGNVFCSIEGIFNSIHEEGSAGDFMNENQLKLTVGYMFFSHLSVYAGVSLNNYNWGQKNDGGKLNPPFVIWKSAYSKIAPGVYLGVRL